MTSGAEKPFPNYLEMPSRLPAWVWWGARIATLGVVVGEVWLIATQPELGMKLFWGLLIPVLPLLFAVAPGLWRQVCPMALLNQLPRTCGLSLERTLSPRFKNIAYLIATVSFFTLVGLRHLYFNTNPAILLTLILGALGLALLGGIVFKGRSGWCGTFCPLAPIQKAYGHAPLATVKNGYCPTCLGCQKNCYDFNPRAALLTDLADPDPWYAWHKRFFVAALPGFAIGFFTASDPNQTGLGPYVIHLGGWTVVSLGIFMAFRAFVRLSEYRAAALSATSALVIFYWFSAESLVDTAATMLGTMPPAWADEAFLGTVLLVAGSVIAGGLRSERAYLELNNGGPAEPKASVDVDVVRAAGASAGEFVTERASGRSFAAKAGQSLLEGIESAGLSQDFGCRMGMCGADPVAVIDGHDNLSPANDVELSTLRRLGLEGRARMACVCKTGGGPVTIDLEADPHTLPEPPPPEDTVDLGEQEGIQRVVIVGNGTSGTTVADEVRRLSPSCKIDIVARENHHFYNRMALGRVLYGRTGIESLYLMTPDWFEKKNVDVWLNTQVSAIDREQRQVRLGTGETLPYDRLVLAQGARAVIPPAEGTELPGCFVLREAADAQAIRTWRQARACDRVVVLGGGVLGVEAADALRRLNLKTTIVQLNDRLMNRELDHKGSRILQRFLEDLGIEVVTGTSVAAVNGDQRVQSVTLTNGDTLPADIYVACAGVRSNAELAAEAGLEVNRGILVNEHMQTSDSNIYAVGDVAELPGKPGGLWVVGTSQAKVAATSLFGISASYEAPSSLVSVKLEGIDVKGFGSMEAGDGDEEFVDPDEPENVHRRLIVRDGHVTGANFVGPPGTGKAVAEIIQNRVDVSPVLDRLRKSDWAALEDALR